MNVRTSYATNSEVCLAYQTTGFGPPDVLLIPDGFIATEQMTELPACARFVDRLSSFCRLIRYDRRGMGLSDPVLPGHPPTLEQWAEDALAVLDDVGSPTTALIGLAEGCFVASVLAATHPERISALVLVHPTPGASSQGRTERITAVAERLDHSELDRIWRGDFPPEYITAFAPSWDRDADYQDWLVRAHRHSASPAVARALLEVIVKSNIDDVLPVISVPTLVVHRRGNTYVSPGYSRQVASAVPGARYADVPGTDHVVYAGDQEPILGEVEEFLTGTRHTPDADRVLATVLFTDLVASTEVASRLGDRRWRELLDQHDTVIRRELDIHRGRLVKTTGDGVLATFDGPARAIRCAQSVATAIEALGLQTRSGLHTGEIEVRGEDIAGIAVHIAARVEAAAGPGEILVSGSVPPLVAGSGISFEDRGEHDLKGVPERWRLLAVISNSQ